MLVCNEFGNCRRNKLESADKRETEIMQLRKTWMGRGGGSAEGNEGMGELDRLALCFWVCLVCLVCLGVLELMSRDAGP